MPKFILDTSGEVPIHGRRTAPNPAEVTRFADLDAFTQGYIEAMFFTDTAYGISVDEMQFANERERDNFEGSISDECGFSELAPETLASIIADCAKFQADNMLELDECMDASPEFSCDMTDAGRNFWYDRCGHGCGFEDGDFPQPHAFTLTEAARKFGNVDTYLGDDGLIYV